MRTAIRWRRVGVGVQCECPSCETWTRLGTDVPESGTLVFACSRCRYRERCELEAWTGERIERGLIVPARAAAS